jgi:hypothetical protein
MERCFAWRNATRLALAAGGVATLSSESFG